MNNMNLSRFAFQRMAGLLLAVFLFAPSAFSQGHGTSNSVTITTRGALGAEVIKDIGVAQSDYYVVNLDSKLNEALQILCDAQSDAVQEEHKIPCKEYEIFECLQLNSSTGADGENEVVACTFVTKNSDGKLQVDAEGRCDCRCWAIL